MRSTLAAGSSGCFGSATPDSVEKLLGRRGGGAPAVSARGRREVGVMLVRAPGHPLSAALTGVAVAPQEGRARFLGLDGRVPPGPGARLAPGAGRRGSG